MAEGRGPDPHTQLGAIWLATSAGDPTSLPSENQ
jgi:hypothetical protein